MWNNISGMTWNPLTATARLSVSRKNWFNVAAFTNKRGCLDGPFNLWLASSWFCNSTKIHTFNHRCRDRDMSGASHCSHSGQDRQVELVVIHWGIQTWASLRDDVSVRDEESVWQRFLKHGVRCNRQWKVNLGRFGHRDWFTDFSGEENPRWGDGISLTCRPGDIPVH